MKLLFLVGDGMGDYPLEELGGKTPLEAAPTPFMDGLASRGIVGRCRTIPESMPPGSDVANMSLLGFDPADYHTGRGPIEAAALGLSLAPTDLVWRMNLVTLSGLTDTDTMKDYSAGHIDNEAAGRLLHTLASELGDDTFSFYKGFQYRHLLVQKDGAASPEAGLHIRPPHDITDQALGPDLQTFRTSPRLWKLVQEAFRLLSRQNSPSAANAIWPWGQGGPMLLPSFHDQFGLKGAVVSAVDLVKGLGRAASMTVVDVPGATGLLDTNYAGKVAWACDLFQDHDFVFLHVEAPDECGHEGSAGNKTEAIARFDRLVVGPLVERFGEQMLFIVACDHFTPVSVRTHTRDPVPFILSGPTVKPDRIDVYTEAAAAQSTLILETGPELLNMALASLRNQR
ncbi:MAG: cofactor-independent phosphoglycerate mutase [Desulfovibrionales bacterium]